jgi:hypothetical protein
VAHDDLHNGQFLQLMGLTNNSSPVGVVQQLLHMQLTHSLKAPGFSTLGTYEVKKNWLQTLLLFPNFQLVPLHPGGRTARRRGARVLA